MSKNCKEYPCGDKNKNCNCTSYVLDTIKVMNEKLEVIVNRFDDMEKILISENMKLRKELDIVQNHSKTLEKKIDAISHEMNNLKQASLSRNIIIKGIPEVEQHKDELRILIRMLFSHLQIKDLANNIDCHRIGKKKDDCSRPIECTVSSVSAKNLIIRTKRKKPVTCAELFVRGKPWGSISDVIYIDEHLSKENHKLFTYARRLKDHGFKYVWTFNGNVFARYDYNCDVIHLKSLDQVVKMLLDAKADKEKGMDLSQSVLNTSNFVPGHADKVQKSPTEVQGRSF